MWGGKTLSINFIVPVGLNKGEHDRLRPIDTHFAFFVLRRTLIQEKIAMLKQN